MRVLEAAGRATEPAESPSETIERVPIERGEGLRRATEPAGRPVITIPKSLQVAIASGSDGGSGDDRDTECVGSG